MGPIRVGLATKGSRGSDQIDPTHTTVGDFMSWLEGFIGKGIDRLIVFPVKVEGGFTNAVMGMGGSVTEAERGLNRQ